MEIRKTTPEEAEVFNIHAQYDQATIALKNSRRQHQEAIYQLNNPNGIEQELRPKISTRPVNLVTTTLLTLQAAEITFSNTKEKLQKLQAKQP